MSGNRRMPVPAIPRIEAPLIELFSSIQGEGVLVGFRQVFIRFADCNLNCDYCDTPFQAQETYRIAKDPASTDFESRPNPANLLEIGELLGDWTRSWPRLHHSLALTGGEPLLHVDVLREWLPTVKSVLPVFLETNGTLPDHLSAVLASIQWVSMDVKLESTSGVPTPWEEHKAFMRCAGEKLCQVKAVIDDSTSGEELTCLAKMMNQHAMGVHLIVRPRPVQCQPALDSTRLLACQATLLDIYPLVRVIPQVHQWLGIA